MMEEYEFEYDFCWNEGAKNHVICTVVCLFLICENKHQ